MLIAFLPKYMMSGNMKLRRVKLSDCPLLAKIMAGDDIVKSATVRRPSRIAWIFFYWWLIRTFFLAYLIEHEGEVIGFAGLFNLSPGGSAEIALVLFSPDFRRKGHGTKAVQMLFESPLLTSLINTLIAKVRKDNDTAQSFWTKLGFRTVRMEADVVIMLKERFAGATHAKESIPTPCQQ